MKFYWCLIIFLLITISVGSLQAQEPCAENTAKILILGSYHMDNPGQDAYNVQADDVLLPKRQREITELVEKLARFKPTKIAIESAYRSTYWTSRYEQYLKGEYKLGRNEIEQIGFQLAKQLNHSALYPIDYPMWMNGSVAAEREEPKIKTSAAQTPSPPAEKPRPAPHIAKMEELLKTATVGEILDYLNSPAYIKADHAEYMKMLLPTNSLFIYQQSDSLTNWYKRNLRMFTNVNRITEFPNDRILLIVGSGHLKILRGFAEDSAYFCLVDTQEYLK
jgi:hypothetical protein